MQLLDSDKYFAEDYISDLVTMISGERNENYNTDMINETYYCILL